jgi:hypothetical protein
MGVAQSREQALDLDRPVLQFTTKRTARAWLYRVSSIANN